MEYEVWPSALKHGVKPEDMLHALQNCVLVFRMEEEFDMRIGPDCAGNLLEIGVVCGQAVIHAMKARNKFIRRKS